MKKVFSNRKNLVITALVVLLVFSLGLGISLALTVNELESYKKENSTFKTQITALESLLNMEKIRNNSGNIKIEVESKKTVCTKEYLDATFENAKDESGFMLGEGDHDDQNGNWYKYEGENCSYNLKTYLEERVKSINSSFDLVDLKYYRGDKVIINVLNSKSQKRELGFFSITDKKYEKIFEYENSLELADWTIISSPDYASINEKMDSIFYRIELSGLGCNDDTSCKAMNAEITRVCKLNQVGTWFYDFATKKATRITAKSTVCK